MLAIKEKGLVNPNNLIKGVRVGNKSVKVYEHDGSKFLVLTRKYFCGICISTETMIVDDYSIAEDCLRNLKAK